METDCCDSVCDVFTVENVKNADEGGYIRVNMRVGRAVPEGVHFYIFKYSCSHGSPCHIFAVLLKITQIVKFNVLSTMPEYVELSIVLMKDTTENVTHMNMVIQFRNAVTNCCTLD